MVHTDLHQLAKTELHCHLDGLLSLPTIRQLAERQLFLFQWMIMS